MRLTGVCASEISWITRHSTHGNPCKLYRIKCEGYEVPDSPYMLRGRMLEPAVLNWYEALTGKHLERNLGTLRHATRPLLLATVDALADGHLVVEAKTAGPKSAHLWGQPGTDQIPLAYLCQVQYQLGVLGHTEAHVPVLLPDLELEIYRVKFDPELFEALAAQAEKFWSEHVEKRVAPKGYRALKTKHTKEQHHGAAGLDRGQSDGGSGEENVLQGSL